MLSIILRAILFFLLAHTVLALVRGVRGTRRNPPKATPPPAPPPPEIDPGDIIDATYRPVHDRDGDAGRPD
jgi:hypothetical protein